jgi:hypothetical protein
MVQWETSPQEEELYAHWSGLGIHHRNPALCRMPNNLSSVFFGTRQRSFLASAKQKTLDKEFLCRVFFQH